MSREPWHYYRAGSIERGPKYGRREGYARVTAAGFWAPWLTRREAQSQANRDGGFAVFHDSEDEARTAYLAAHRAADPHCTCPDCITDHAAQEVKP